MRRSTLLPACLLLAAGLFPVPHAVSAPPADPAPASPRLTGSNYKWMMIEADIMMHAPGGGQKVLQLCRRAAASGYNGLLLWDSNLWDRQLPSGYMENAAHLRQGL